MTRDLQAFLMPFEAPHASGEDLRYAPVYDLIREARRGDDPRLTQGVWEQEVKQADWKQVEHLASQALRAQSKDLKITGWLGEAWIALEGLEGLKYALELTQGLCDHFWETIYPCDPDDIETRVRCFEWIDVQWAERMTFIPITQPSVIKDKAYTLVDWVDGHHYAKLAKQSVGGTKAKAASDVQGQLLEAVRAAVHHTDGLYYDAMRNTHQAIHQTVQTLEESLRVRLAPQFHMFSTIRDTLSVFEEVMRIHQRDLGPLVEPDGVEAPLVVVPSGPAVSLPLSMPQPMPEWPDAYGAIAEALKTLKMQQPHSPVVPLLQTALRWKDLSFLDMLKLFEDVGLNAQQVLKLFMMEGSK